MQRMPSVVVVVSALVLVGFSPVSVRAQKITEEQELMQLERAWCTAELKKDAALLGRILANDFAGVGGAGVVQTKADALANLNDQTNATTTCVDSNVKVRIYGDAAVVTGLGTRSGTYTAFRERQMLWTDTFIKRDGRWQCVASQGTWITVQTSGSVVRQ